MQSGTGVAGVSASRQKNCDTCVHAKRRCDRRTPVCSRCAEKRTPCTYTKTRAIRRPRRQDIEPLSYVDQLSFESPPSSGLAPGLALDLGYVDAMSMHGQQSTPASVENTHNSSLAYSDNYGNLNMDPLIHMTESGSAPIGDQWHAAMEQGAITESPSSLADEEVLKAYQKMSSFCHNVEPWHLYDRKTTLHYLVTRFKGFVKDVATRNATPFLHKRLYQDYTPFCILSCFTITVLYVNRTEANAAMVMRALHGSIRQLIDAEAGRLIATPTEKLARTQTLFLYQVIRLFDGDITLRSQGERDMSLLQTWLDDLCRVRGNVGDLAELQNGEVQRDSPEEWERWIFAESVRRTIVIAYSFIKLYEMMNHPELEHDPGPWAYVHRWTLSRHLWEADSANEFERMWKEKPHFIIDNYSFAGFLEHGRGDDIDEFAQILLSVYMGVDKTTDFISAQDTRNNQ